MDNIKILSFYKFYPYEKDTLSELRRKLMQDAKGNDIQGLIILSVEGCNATLSAPPKIMDEYQKQVENTLGWKQTFYTTSWAKIHPFHEMQVKIRKEIVTLQRPDLVPRNTKHRHLSPSQWQKIVQEEDVFIIDIRNNYEYYIGQFKSAINPKIKEFTQFPQWIKKSNIPKDKQVLIYCTGGIRCEKAILDMEEQGYNRVHQLEGGILNYLQQFPNEEFEGECFVFDYRVAVDQNLRPTENYRLCPHCGDPGDQPVTCLQCERKDIVCKHCFSQGDEFKTCSKNCAHHYRLGHTTNRLHQDSHRKRHPFSTLEPV